MRLTWRERIAIGVGGALLVGILISYFGIAPAQRRIKELNRRIPELEEDLMRIKELNGEYQELKEKVDSITKGLEARGDFAIPTFLENLAREVKVEYDLKTKPERRIGERYKESSVEVKLEGIDLEDLRDFLYKIENSDQFLRVVRLRITPNKADPEEAIDATFDVSTIIMK